tara:strand:+ start:200 stop:1324 length:1125 start_codon:yes stop_codon:yes gene_type:complete
MHLIQFTRQKPPGFGGVERIANDISNFALSKSIKVFNIYFSNSNKCLEKTNYVNLKLNLHLLVKIKKILKRNSKLNKNKFIFIFHLPSISNFLFYVILRLLYSKYKFIIYWHCFITHRNPLIKICFKLYQFSAIKIFSFFNTELITTSPILKKELNLNGINLEKIHILPCCISDKEEKFLLKNQCLNKSTSAQKFNLIFIGRLCDYKKVDWIFKIMKDRKYINLDIIGTGKNSKKYRYIVNKLGIKERVQFHGRLDDLEKLKILKESDVLILSSTTPNEAFGIVQLEAMAAGVVPIATHIEKSGVSWVGNISSFLNFGIIDKQRLGKIIDKLWLEKDIFQSCKIYSKKRYLKRFSRECWEDNIKNYFNKIIFKN